MWLSPEDSLYDQEVDQHADHHAQQLGDGEQPGAPGSLLVQGYSFNCIQCEDRLVRKVTAVSHVNRHHGPVHCIGGLCTETDQNYRSVTKMFVLSRQVKNSL